MGNYCCEGEVHAINKTPSPKKRIVSNSTRSNEGHGMEQAKFDGIEIIEILNSNKRVSMRPEFPRITHVQVLQELGKGAQADVFKVTVETNDESERLSLGNRKATLAIKRINLQQQRKNEKSLDLATQILIQNDCPFLMKGFFYLKNQKYLYEGMKYAEGGDLTSFMEKTTGKGDAFRKLGEVGIKMLSAGIILGLEYLHKKCLIYCDLKPDNILVGIDGYPMLTDFQLAKSQKQIPTNLFQGTITSVGPQIYESQTFDKSVDLWALGVLLYTLAYNQYPFQVEDILKQSYIQQCKKRQNKYKLNRKKISQNLTDLINKLLKCNPSERIGYQSLEQIKKHAFFNKFQWQKYQKKELPNPIAQIVKKFSKNKMSYSAQYN